MPYSLANPPTFAKNKSDAAKKAAVEAANAVLAKDGTEEEAIFAAISAVKRVEGHSTTKIHKSTNALAKLTRVEEPKEIIKAAILPGSISPDPSRSLIHADFNAQNKLVLTFSDGKRLTTRAIDVVALTQEIGIVAGASKDPVVRVISADTTVLPDDDIIIATDYCIITLPSAIGWKRSLRIKRSSLSDVVVQPVLDQTIDGDYTKILNINYYSIDLHSDGSNWVIL